MEPEQSEAQSQAEAQEEQPRAGSYEPYLPYVPGVPAVVTPAIYAGEVASNPYFDMVKAHFDERLAQYLASLAASDASASEEQAGPDETEPEAAL